MNEEQLIQFYNIERNEKGYWYKGVYEYGKKLHEFGKYTDFNPPKKSLKKFFKNKELMEKKYIENDFYVVTKEFLQYIIETYTKYVENYYNDMLSPFLGIKNTIFENEAPSEFYNTIKVEYGYPNNKINFDFSKITQEEQNKLFQIIEHVREMRIEWTCLKPYDLNDNREEITKSWKYEYNIFELVRIYKTFDWKRNVMIYYGY